MLDKNNRELRTGQVVYVSGGYFKSDNGLFRITHSPNDENWSGSDHCLKRVNKKWIDSKAKYSVAFYPLMVTTNNMEQKLIAKEHNKNNSSIKILGSVKMYKVKTITIRGGNEFENISYVTESEFKELTPDHNFKIEILEEIPESKIDIDYVF